MIVTRIDGGLGNQMFQYAFGLQVAQANGTDLVLDLSAYGDRPLHGLSLNRFKIEAGVLDDNQRDRLPRKYKLTSSPIWQDWFRSGTLKRVKEKPFGYADKYLRSGDNSYLVGYWQSELFFPHVRQSVRQHFQLAMDLSDDSKMVVDRIRNTPSLALHIRRGDYLSNPQAAAIYRHLSLDYYRRAVLARLTERTGVEVTVFSNDIPWCQENLKLPCPTHFVTTSAGPHEELAVMSEAEAIAIANSTFSWWAAWLSNRPEPRVFAPRKWFHPGTLNDRFLACPGWTLLDDSVSQTAVA